MTTPIRSLIIDDELANHSVLQNLLSRHCPHITICGNAFSAEEGLMLIAQHRPDLIFLDIKMPRVSGFDMLRTMEHIPFEVIFISGFDEYAIQAFEFNAVDYVLKPIDYTRLTAAVTRAGERLGYRKKQDNSAIIHFIRSLDEQPDTIRRITLHQNEKVHIINLDEVVYIKAASTYSEILTTSSKKFLSAKSLGDFEIMLEPAGNFFRINRSMLINTNYITHYTKGSNCFIAMKYTNDEIEVSRRRKTAILAALNRNQNGLKS